MTSRREDDTQPTAAGQKPSPLKTAVHRHRRIHRATATLTGGSELCHRHPAECFASLRAWASTAISDADNAMTNSGQSDDPRQVAIRADRRFASALLV